MTTLHDIVAYLNLTPPMTCDASVLREVLVSFHERQPSQLEAINDLPLYPTEDLLWDENIVPSEYYNGESELVICCLHILCFSLFISSTFLTCSLPGPS